MYSSAASVTLGHHETSSDLNFRRFSAMSSIPSSVILEHPDSDNTVRLGNVWTKMERKTALMYLKVLRFSLKYKYRIIT